MSAYSKHNAASDPLAITNEEESEFCKELQILLDAAYKLQDASELLFLDQVRLGHLLYSNKGTETVYNVTFGTEDNGVVFRKDLSC